MVKVQRAQLYSYISGVRQIYWFCLSVGGFIGAALLLPRAWMMLFTENEAVMLTMAIWVQEMVFGLWLIVKGFNPQSSINLNSFLFGKSL